MMFNVNWIIFINKSQLSDGNIIETASFFELIKIFIVSVQSVNLSMKHPIYSLSQRNLDVIR